MGTQPDAIDRVDAGVRHDIKLTRGEVYVVLQQLHSREGALNLARDSNIGVRMLGFLISIYPNANRGRTAVLPTLAIRSLLGRRRGGGRRWRARRPSCAS